MKSAHQENPRQAGRYAVVTGGGSGLGREFCLALARAGVHVAVAGIERDGLEETHALLQAAGGSGQVEICDVTQQAAWQALRERLQVAWPRLDVLVNNAGVFATGHVGTLDLDDARRLLDLNLRGVLYGCHTMVPWLVGSAAAPGTESPAPHVVNVASAFGFLCPPGMAPYNASKAAVIALSETLLGELRPRGVGVTVVCPGPMPTRFIDRATFESDAFRRMTEGHVKRSTLDPARVATATLDAMQRGQLYVVLGRRERWYWRCKRWLPATLLHRVARRVRRDLASAAKEQFSHTLP